MRRIATFLLLLTSALAVSAQPFEEGVHYQTITPAQPVDEAGAIEVVEVFSYACPHCASFQPFIEAWNERAPESVTFRRLPAVFRASWEPFARTYYTIEALGLVGEAHDALFDALHRERRRLRTTEDLAAFVASVTDVSEEEFLKTANSFAIETKLRRGMSQVQRYGVDATPSVIINGKYRATANMAGSVNKLMDLMDYLVALESDNAATTASAD